MEIDFHDGDLDFLADFDDFRRIADEVVGQVTDVDEAVLVDSDIDKGSEGSDVGDDAGEFHAGGEVAGFFNSLSEGEVLEGFAGVAARFGKLGEDILEGWEADFFGDIFPEVDFLPEGIAAHEIGDGATGIGGHFLDECVALWVDGGGIQRVGGISDAEEACGLLEGFVAEACDFFQLGTGGEAAVFRAEGDDVFREGIAEAGDVG